MTNLQDETWLENLSRFQEFTHEDDTVPPQKELDELDIPHIANLEILMTGVQYYGGRK